jgi:hypothetical protein
MKRLLILPVLLALTLPLHAQHRYLVGGSVGDSFNNTNAGVAATLEVPFTRHYEFDLTDIFSPLESKRVYGNGNANILRGSSIVWITNGFGLTANAELSSYKVTQISKSTVYVFGGPVWRSAIWGFPTRIELHYLREMDNGIISGVETQHLQGGQIKVSIRMGCFSKTCIRVTEEYALGHVLTQGNPVCDGSYGPVVPSCARIGKIGGSVEAMIQFEFPRRKDTEDLAF